MLYTYRATVTNIVDGDTADFRIDCGFKVYHDLRVRFLGINAPEKRTQEGKDAKVWLEAQIPVGTQVILETKKDEKEKYGRYLATVYLGELDINQELVKSGHAVEYHGGKR